jgi:hypothetical protein
VKNGKGNVNLNKMFPGWKRAAINGNLTWWDMNGVYLTCDARDSFELFSPPGTPCLSVNFLSSRDCISNLVRLRGNWGDAGYGLPWEDSSTGVHGYHGPLTDANPFSVARFSAGHVFMECEKCYHRDATVIDVPVLATGGQMCGDSESERILIVQTQPLREYIQWHAQYASTRSLCRLVDIEFDSVALLPGIEGMHGEVDIIRPRGRNFTMAMNNASGIIDNPNIDLEPGCVEVHRHFPIFRQSFYYSPIINLNKNAAVDNPWGAQGGIILIHPIINQPEKLDNEQGNMTSISVQELPHFQMKGGMEARYPDQLEVGNGAVGIQSYAHGGYFDGKMDIKGKCVNERNAWKVFAVNGPKSGPSLELPPGEHVFG